MDKEEHDRVSQLIEDGYLEKDLEPVRCHKCRSACLTGEVKAIDGRFVSEKEVSCTICGQVLGYWAYGHWQA